MKICVSACLLGENCKYSGGNNQVEGLLNALSGHELIPVCPEMLGGLPCPRPSAEIKGTRVINAAGEDVTAAYEEGTRCALERASGCGLAILQPRSPSCGVHEIYDGTFTGQLIPGSGIFAQALISRGIPSVEPHELDRVLPCRLTGIDGDE